MHDEEEMMPDLLLHIDISLDDNDPNRPWRTNGPGFHRWLPDGRQDALTLNTEDPTAELQVWFERWGATKTTEPRAGFVEFSTNRHEVDPTIMERQGVLDAGPLLGMLILRDVPQEQLDAVVNDRRNDPAYVALGKRVVKRLHPPISRLVDILRTTYGQFWLRRIVPWDSRQESLSVYCARFGLHWSIDTGASWTRFMPDTQRSHGTTRLVSARFQDYITQQDWSELEQLVNSDFEPSDGANLLTRARHILITGNPRHALIEAVTALDVAVAEFVRLHTKLRKTLADQIQSFQTLRLPAQLAMVALNQPEISDEDLQVVFTVIKRRNEVVHEGKEPPDDLDRYLEAAYRVVAALLPGSSGRMPPLPFMNNWLRTPEEWDADP
ncbi:MAG: hypothetical protein AB7R89_03555 [Dehalococcoidia bacterium]